MTGCAMVADSNNYHLPVAPVKATLNTWGMPPAVTGTVTMPCAAEARL